MPTDHRLFAVVPAAGQSRRMGQPKLLLPLAGQTVLARLLTVLQRDEVTDRFVVIRPDDEPLRTEAERAGAVVIQPPSAPPEMRASVEHALAAIQDRHHPRPDDGWMLVPADHPILEQRVLDELIATWNRQQPQILVPTFQGRRGHPTFFQWSLAEEVGSLPAACGLNRLLQIHADDVSELPVESPAVLFDLDTPEEYESLRREWEA